MHMCWGEWDWLGMCSGARGDLRKESCIFSTAVNSAYNGLGIDSSQGAWQLGGCSLENPTSAAWPEGAGVGGGMGDWGSWCLILRLGKAA